MSLLLNIDNLTKRFGGLTAVDNVSFEMQEGEIVGLLGPNGSGKTTLLNTISGALKATSGTILMNEVAIQALRPDQISHKGIARTFQLVRILPTMTVVENVVCGLAFGPSPMWGEAAQNKAQEKLELVGLGDKTELMAASLNYIDSKRLELARALAMDPKLLLLDEWLSGLTPEELETGVSLIESIGKTGVSILIVEHIMGAIRALCPRCIVMNAGQKIADGATADVLQQEEVVAAYLGEQHA